MRSSSPATTPQGPQLASGEEAALAEWTVHLARSSPSKLWGVGGGSAVAALFGWMAFRGWVGAALGAGLVLSAVAEFLLPVRYRLTTHGAYCSYGLARLAIPWPSVRRVILGANSVRLSPFRTPSRLDAFRGVELRFGDADSDSGRDRVLSIIVERTGWDQ